GWPLLGGPPKPAGPPALAASLEVYFGDTPMTLIFGVLRDKDAAGILQPLLGRARRVILTASASPRAAVPAALPPPAPSSGPATVAPWIGEALALAEAPPADRLVCVAGSLALVGAVLANLDGTDKPCPVKNTARTIGPR